jgi:hypothetical protein
MNLTAIDLTFGNILTILAIVAGLLIHYIAFSNRLSKFEGYTKAKLEDHDKDLQCLWTEHRELVKQVKK